MTANVRYIEKFVSIDTLTSYSFGTNKMVVTPSQNVRVPLAVGIGADYAHDFSGFGVGARDTETIGLSWIITKSTAALVDAEIDTCRSALLSIGKGKLYAVFADASERWCYARINSMPMAARPDDAFLYHPMATSFTRLSNWYSTTTSTSGPTTITTYQSMQTLTNSGNAYVRDLVLTFDALAAAGWTSLSVFNATTGETVSTTRSAETASSEWQINGYYQAVYYSHDSGLYIGAGYIGESGIGGGALLADDYAYVTRGATQAGLISLKPGANQIIITCSGTPNYTFSAAWTAQFA